MNLGPEFKAEIIRILRARSQLTVPQLAALTAQSIPRVQYCMHVLRGIGVAIQDKPPKRGQRANWRLTGKPLPPEYTSRKTTHSTTQHGYDHRAIAFALSNWHPTTNILDEISTPE